MTDQSTFDLFEQRLAHEMAGYVADVFDHTPTIVVAERAMKPRGVATRVRNSSRSRRFLLLGLVAILAIPAAYFGAALLQRPVPPPDAPVYQPVYSRRVEGANHGVGIYTIRSDGAEHLIRLVPDVGNHWDDDVPVSTDGWAAVHDVEHVEIINLADPMAQPWRIDETNVRFTSVLFVDSPWSPNGLLAGMSGPMRGELFVADPDKHKIWHLSTGGSVLQRFRFLRWTPDGSAVVAINPDNIAETIPVDGGPIVAGEPSLTDQEFGVEPSREYPGPNAGDYFALSDKRRPLDITRRSSSSETLLHVADWVGDWWSLQLAGLAPDRSQIAIYGVAYRYDGREFHVPTWISVPFAGDSLIFRSGAFGGYIDVAGSAGLSEGEYVLPYEMPPVDDFITSELSQHSSWNPIAELSRDASKGPSGTVTEALSFEPPAKGQIVLWCVGNLPASISIGVLSIPSPCTPGSSAPLDITPADGDRVTIQSSTDTSWRVVVYSTQ